MQNDTNERQISIWEELHREMCVWLHKGTDGCSGDVNVGIMSTLILCFSSARWYSRGGD